jgi:hypothetical protein
MNFDLWTWRVSSQPQSWAYQQVREL